MVFKKEFNQLLRAKESYNKKLRVLEELIQEKCEFHCGIEYLSGDGLMVLNQDSANVASLSTCLQIIKEEGKLTKMEHDKYSK